MDEKSEEYIKGYEQGVRDMAERLKKYYASLPVKTMPSVVEYHIDQKMKELLEKEE